MHVASAMKISQVHILFIFFFAAKISFCSAGLPSDTLTPLVTYKHFGEEDGLHCKTIYEAIQDKDGFMWFSTDAGVFRFDGKKFKQYNIEHGVTDKEVLKIFQDSYGRIWFLTLNGRLSFWKEGKIYNPSNTPFLKQAYAGSIFAYYEDTHQRIWLGTTSHTYIVIDRDSVRLIEGPYQGYTGEGHRQGSIYVHEDADGNIWSFNMDKMFRFSDHKITEALQLPGFVGDGLLCHRNKSADVFFLDWQKSVYKISDKSVAVYADEKDILFTNTITNMVYDEGNLWFCTRGNGCYRMVNGKFSERYFNNSFINSVFRDREDNLWFTTVGEGVYMLPSSAHFVKNYNEQSGLPSNNVTSFVLDTQGKYWLGFQNGFVDKIENQKATRFKLGSKDKVVLNRVVALAADSAVIFCATDEGAFFIQEDKVQPVQLDTTFPHSGLSGKQLFIDKKRHVYIAHSSGFEQLVKTNHGYYAMDMMDSIERAFAGIEYPEGHLLISGAGGLSEYIPGGKLVPYETDITFSSIRVLDMKLVPENLLALATNGKGIYFLEGKKLYQHLSTIEGLSDNNCKRIFVSNDVMYISTDKGLNVLSYKNKKWSVSGVITTNNGLLSNTVNDVAERNGIIYVATERGLSEFSKEIIAAKKFVGKAYVTEMTADSTFAVSDTAYNFNADIPRLLIKFSYPVFDPSNRLKVSYRLLHDRADDVEWTTSETNEIEFSSLGPGQYIFQVKPNGESISTAGITNLYINIIPLWWQTTTARIAFALLVVSLIFFIVKTRIQLQYKKRLQQLTMLEDERSRIASDMHDDIGADLTQISMWSGILKLSKDEKVIDRITNSSNEVLQKMEQIIWALNSFQNHTSDLIVYLREFASQYLEGIDIHLSFQADEALPELELSAILKRNIFLTVKELLHNTVKHSEAKNVTIKIYHADSFLHIEYKDDGKGFTPKAKEDGLGNITIQKRMQEINSSVKIKSKPGEGFSAHLEISLAADKGRQIKM